ncbi:hypothetical protein MTR_4g120840 [Medicago truncatula]|uniref:Uncharacterized protein n=1 Tax=Medicago truncatula TaxID=3880 RepID=G7JMQ0_MEDTR|nr:hypothetical protein MTR_4g120840 [Medicago truncatula]
MSVSKLLLWIWKLELELLEGNIARLVILSKLPFSVVESDRFNRLCKLLQPLWNIPSRRTVARDCFRMFRDEKFKLIAYFKSDCSKLALTPKVWTSIQNFSYISLTAPLY